MADNDTLTYQVKRSPLNQAKSVDQSLITQERSQKLDLLMHLLANLTQSLVVSGPDGIGKSTLLKALLERQVNSWLYCLVQATEDLSFEKILDHITGVLSRDNTNTSLSVALSQYESQNKKIIVMIDDAGDLVPGLITSLIQYAAANPALRVVFVVTPDDLYVKNRTDRAIEDCHFVEIPPLSEKQCGEFLQHLAAKPLPQIAFSSINDSLIEKIYRETHGIPGKIITKLPNLSSPKAGRNPTTILISAVAALVVIALGIQWHSASNHHEVKRPADVRTGRQPPKIVPALPQPKPAPAQKSEPLSLGEQFGRQNNVELLSGQQQENKTILKPIKADDVNKSPVEAETVTVDKNKTAETANAENIIPKPENKPQPDNLKESVSPNNIPVQMSPPNKAETIQQPQLKPVENQITPEKKSVDEAALAKGGASWIKTQPSDNFTLQLMILTKEQATKDLIKKNHALSKGLTYIKRRATSGKDMYFLLFGSYPSFESAESAKQSMPPEFRNAFIRKFRTLK